MATVLFFIFAVLLIALDQILKAIISNSLLYGEGIPVIDGFFDIVHWHNTGGAWGILSDKTWLLSIVTILASIIIIYILLVSKPRLLRFSLVLILSGAIGNLIDRIRLGYVVDFLFFNVIFKDGFPAFNVADICVVTGSLLLAAYILFFSGKKQSFKENSFIYKILCSQGKKADVK